MGGRATKQRDLLEGSEWLRTVVAHYQKRRGGVSMFESFSIEPALTFSMRHNALLSRQASALCQQQHEDQVVGQAGGGGVEDAAAVISYNCNPEICEVFQSGGARLTRVTVRFRNAKDHSQTLDWLVKSASYLPSSASVSSELQSTDPMISSVSISDAEAVNSLQHEIRVYASLLAEIHKFLQARKNPRAKFLLNLPEFVFQEIRRGGDGHSSSSSSSGGSSLSSYVSTCPSRCHLVLEDITKTKNCRPLNHKYIETGMCLGQFRVFLGTLAQFHASCLAWKLSSADDDSFLDLHPYLAPLPRMPTEDRRSKSSSIRSSYSSFNDPLEVLYLLDLYEKLLHSLHLNQYGSPSDLGRRLKLVAQLRVLSQELLSEDLRTILSDPLGSVCLGGDLRASEVLFQTQRPLASFFEFGTRPSYMPDLHTSSDLLPSSAGDQRNAAVVDPAQSPLCAAITTCHRVHFGLISRELAGLFMSLPSGLVKRNYLVYLLQSYCHVLTTTLELLDVDWPRHYRAMNFPLFVSQFFEQVPSGMLCAILTHMRMTNPLEVDKLARGTLGRQGSIPGSARSCCNRAQARKESQYIQLSPERIQFLVSLTDSIKKPV